MPEGLLDSEGTVRFSSSPAALTVVFAGDLCPTGRVETMLASGRAQDALGGCLPLLLSADLSLVNLEAPLCGCDSPIAKCGPHFRADPRVARALAEAGVDVACLANNHVLDQGHSGLTETLAALDGAGIRRVGAGMTARAAAEPIDIDLAGIGLTILNFAEGEFSRAEGGPGAAGLDELANPAAVSQAAARGRVVIVVLHAGNEQVLFPSPAMQRRCRRLVDAGAAAVVAHHPHVPQGIEVYRRRPIAYSLGNFLFDWPEPEPETDSSFLLALELGPSGVCAARVQPFRKSSCGGAELLAGTERADYLSLLNELSAPLGDVEELARLWEQQCVGLFESRYLGKFRRLAGLITSPDTDRSGQDMLMALNLLNCPAHAEAVATILRLAVSDRLKPIEPQASTLATLMGRLKAFARQAKSAS